MAACLLSACGLLPACHFDEEAPKSETAKGASVEDSDTTLSDGAFVPTGDSTAWDSDAAGPGPDVTSPHACQHTYWQRAPFSPPKRKGRSLRVMALPGGDIVVVGQYAAPTGGKLVLGATRYTRVGALVWERSIAQAMPTGGAAALNPDADAVDASRIYLGWAAPGDGLWGPKTGWRVAALDHTGHLLWTLPRGQGRSVQVVCLASAATTILAAGGEVLGLRRGTNTELTAPIIGRLSPQGKVQGVAKGPLLAVPGEWKDCAHDNTSSTLVLAGVSGPRGWVSAWKKGVWRFNKTFSPPGSAFGTFGGVVVTDEGSYVAVGRAYDYYSPTGRYAEPWFVGLDPEGHERFNVQSSALALADWLKLPVARASGGFATVTFYNRIYLQGAEALQHFDRWGNALFGTVVGYVKLFGGPQGLLQASFTAHDMISLPDGTLVIAGEQQALHEATGNLIGFGRVYRADVWGYGSCAQARKCGSLTPEDCADTDPCTRDFCSPNFGCVNLPQLTTQMPAPLCGEGKVCQDDGTCVVKEEKGTGP